MKHLGYITERGILLDNCFNKLRDEGGYIIVIPKNQRWCYATITKQERALYE